VVIAATLLVMAVGLIWFSSRRYYIALPEVSGIEILRRNYQSSIKQKLGASIALQLILIAQQYGIDSAK
jgi:hypothetical protein